MRKPVKTTACFLRRLPVVHQLVVVVASLLLAISLGADKEVQAQVGAGDWAEPTNLSRSGSTDKPQIVADSDGIVHIFWQDIIAGYFYARGDGQTWSQPQLVDVPFGLSVNSDENPGTSPPVLFEPLVIADDGGLLHTFWRDRENALFYSRVAADSFASLAEWSPAQRLAESSLDMNVTIDSNGRIHLAYVRALDSSGFPAGIYHRWSLDGGESWSQPTPLFASPYFRGLDPEAARVRIVSTNPENILVAWDDRPQERVFIVRSTDAGNSWQDPQEMDRRLATDGVNAVGPGNVLLAGHDTLIHLSWQAGHEGQLCSQYHQFSTDGGTTWQPPSRLEGLESTCPEESRFIVTDDGRFLLAYETTTGTLFTSWDGNRWRTPAIQQGLTGFVNPDTFRQVELGCRRYAIVGDSSDGNGARLLVVGCDRGRGEDIWYTSADISTLIGMEGSDLPTIWRPEQQIASALAIESVILAEDSQGQLYAFWQEPEEESVRILQSVYTEEEWTSPFEVLQITAESANVEPMLFLGSDDVLTAIWTDGSPGALNFTQAFASPTLSQSDWSAVDELPVFRPAASAPYMAEDLQGRVWVAYALPLNEERGIYLTESADGGGSWTAARQVFDGIEAGWEMVDRPVLTAGSDGSIHLMWAQYTSPPDAQVLSLVYSKSDDGGFNWSEPTTVTQSPKGWASVAETADGSVHRVWIDSDNILWGDSSFDGGTTWESDRQLTSATDGVEAATIAHDFLYRPQLMAVVVDNSVAGRSPQMFHWRWTGSEWERGEIHESSLATVQEMAAVVRGDGSLEAAVVGKFSGFGGENAAILSTGRALADLGVTVEQPVLPTPELVPTETPTSEPELTLVPTPFLPAELGPEANLPGPPSGSGIFSGPVLGIALAAFVVGVVSFVSIRYMQNRRF